MHPLLLPGLEPATPGPTVLTRVRCLSLKPDMDREVRSHPDSRISAKVQSWELGLSRVLRPDDHRNHPELDMSVAYITDCATNLSLSWADLPWRSLWWPWLRGSWCSLVRRPPEGRRPSSGCWPQKRSASGPACRSGTRTGFLLRPTEKWAGQSGFISWLNSYSSYI